MKKTILISFLLLLCSLFYGQGTSYNLGFSQVKLVGNTTETVPSGKVWKITNVMPSSNSTSSNVDIKVNSNTVRVKSMDFYQGGTSTSTPTIGSWNLLNGAIWLPSGTSLSSHTNCQYISVVEFNIE